VPEAAGLLRISERQIRRLIAKQQLEVTRVGRSVRISPEAVAALIKSK
jgi:excisionase family DNA binding protein